MPPKIMRYQLFLGTVLPTSVAPAVYIVILHTGPGPEPSMTRLLIGGIVALAFGSTCSLAINCWITRQVRKHYQKLSESQARSAAERFRQLVKELNL